MSAGPPKPTDEAPDVEAASVEGPPVGERPELQPFRIQLVEVHCATLSAKIEAATEGESATEPEIEAELLQTELGADLRSFGCRLQLRLRVVAPPAKTEISLTVQGAFQALEDINQEYYEAFVAYTPVALLWPYARSYAAELSRMLGVVLSPLPTLDALNVVTEPPVQAPEQQPAP